MVTHHVYSNNHVSILRTNNIFNRTDVRKKQEVKVIISRTKTILTCKTYQNISWITSFVGLHTKYQLELPWPSNDCICCSVLITKSMSANAYGFCPSCQSKICSININKLQILVCAVLQYSHHTRHKPRNILADDWFSENSSCGKK